MLGDSDPNWQARGLKSCFPFGSGGARGSPPPLRDTIPALLRSAAMRQWPPAPPGLDCVVIARGFTSIRLLSDSAALGFGKSVEKPGVSLPGPASLTWVYLHPYKSDGCAPVGTAC